MIKRTILSSLLLLSSVAFATTSSNNNGSSNSSASQSQGQAQEQAQIQGQAQGQSMSNRVSNRTSVATSSTSLSAAQGGAGGHSSSSSSSQGGAGGSSTSSSTSQGSSASVNYSEPGTQFNYNELSGTTTVKNTPDLSLGTPPPSAPCIVTWGSGGSGPGFSIGINGFKEDVTCTVREIRRIAGDNPQIRKEADAFLLSVIRDFRGRQDEYMKAKSTVGPFGY